MANLVPIDGCHPYLLVGARVEIAFGEPLLRLALIVCIIH
jgi:hypothetical protein